MIVFKLFHGYLWHVAKAPLGHFASTRASTSRGNREDDIYPPAESKNVRTKCFRCQSMAKNDYSEQGKHFLCKLSTVWLLRLFGSALFLWYCRNTIPPLFAGMSSTWLSEANKEHRLQVCVIAMTGAKQECSPSLSAITIWLFANDYLY